MRQETTKQAAEKLIRRGTKRQGTTSVVPKVFGNKMAGFSPCSIYCLLFGSPQRLKPDSKKSACLGTTEVVP
jgi:hypothetical protein